MSKMVRPKTFSDTIRPILILNILFGTGTFVLSKEQTVRKSVERIYMVVVWISFNVLYIMQYFYYNVIVPTEVHINLTMAIVWSLVTYQLSTLLIFVTKFRAKTTQDLMEAIDKVDQKMQSIRLPSQYSIQYKHQMYQLGGWLVHVTICLVITWIFRIKPNTPIMEKIAATICVNLVTTMVMVVQLSFTLWVGHIQIKFSQLNQLLEEMIETIDRSAPKRFLEVRNSQVQKRRRQNVHDLKDDEDTIMTAKTSHLDLIKIARRINKFYGMQLLMSSLIWFLTIVILLYMLNIFIWQTLPRPEIFQEFITVTIWTMITISRMIHLHSNCVRTSNEASKAGFLLCRLYNSSTSIKFRAEVQHFTHQVKDNPLVFNVCGLIDIDHMFLSNMMGTIFAYLIVIFQLAWPQRQRRQNIAANLTNLNATASYI